MKIFKKHKEVNLLNNKRIVVVMPAYNAYKTLERTYNELPFEIVDDVILVDDCSSDNTYTKAKKLGIKHIIRHDKNTGYGGNQKSCYQKASEIGADVIIMVHPDYQYDPRLVTSLASLISNDVFDCVLASRILGVGALQGGMPIYKYISNRLLTLYQNLIIPYKLSEYHTGYRAFSREVIDNLPLENNSDNFIFDNQMLLQIIGKGFRIGEVSCPTRYMDDSSSINIPDSLSYGFNVLWITITYKLAKIGLLKSKIFQFRNKG
jgi:glycosyltransferase involved in cell wall biosynthesis